MKLYYIVGNQGTGKTTLTKQLLVYIARSKGIDVQTIPSVPRVHNWGIDRIAERLESERNGTVRRISEVASILLIDKVRIAFWSQGDLLSLVQAGYDFAKTNQCDVLVATCHSQNTVRQWFCSLAKNGETFELIRAFEPYPLAKEYSEEMIENLGQDIIDGL